MQSFSFMVFPAPLKHTLIVASLGYGLYVIAVIAIIGVPLAATGDTWPLAVSGYDDRFALGSALMEYVLVLINGWLYARMYQRGLRRLFLLTKRKKSLLDTLGGGSSAVANTNSSASEIGEINIHRVKSSRLRSDLALAHRFLRDGGGVVGSAEVVNGNVNFSSLDRSHKIQEEHGEDNAGAYGVGNRRNNNNDQRSHSVAFTTPPATRPITAKSLSPSIKEDWDAPMTRPGTGIAPNAFPFHHHVGSVYSSTISNYEQALNAPSAKKSNTNPTKVVMISEEQPTKHEAVSTKEPLEANASPNWLFLDIFLGQIPFPPSTESRYLRSLARMNADSFTYAMSRLTVINLITSILDHYDRLRTQSSELDTQTIIARFLALLIPCTLVPLASAITCIILKQRGLLIGHLPLVFATFLGLAAAYLLSPMELLSSVHPDSFPQSKATSYLVVSLIMSAQTGLIPARGFIAWCVAVLFLTLAHIPLALTWGGDFDRRMPWGMGIQVTILLVALSALVRLFDGLSREGYESLLAVRAFARLVTASASRNGIETVYGIGQVGAGVGSKNGSRRIEGVAGGGGGGLLGEGTVVAEEEGEEDGYNEGISRSVSLRQHHGSSHIARGGGHLQNYHHRGLDVGNSTHTSSRHMPATAVKSLSSLYDLYSQLDSETDTVPVQQVPKSKQHRLPVTKTTAAEKLDKLLMECDAWIAEATNTGLSDESKTANQQFNNNQPASEMELSRPSQTVPTTENYFSLEESDQPSRTIPVFEHQQTFVTHAGTPRDPYAAQYDRESITSTVSSLVTTEAPNQTQSQETNASMSTHATGFRPPGDGNFIDTDSSAREHHQEVEPETVVGSPSSTFGFGASSGSGSTTLARILPLNDQERMMGDGSIGRAESKETSRRPSSAGIRTSYNAIAPIARDNSKDTLRQSLRRSIHEMTKPQPSHSSHSSKTQLPHTTTDVSTVKTTDSPISIDRGLEGKHDGLFDTAEIKSKIGGSLSTLSSGPTVGGTGSLNSLKVGRGNRLPILGGKKDQGSGL
ncbi:hypothetical protein HDU76_002918 [Blyttiomyces sp. JEL0837]|nr:hypothetical protein HDU76_002918 [Blyttiomyces sp. JEL0837]